MYQCIVFSIYRYYYGIRIMNNNYQNVQVKQQKYIHETWINVINTFNREFLRRVCTRVLSGATHFFDSLHANFLTVCALFALVITEPNITYV